MVENKLLLLGGKPIGSVEIVKRAQEMGAHVIVADYLSKDESYAKRIADESWDISTADIKTLAEKCKETNVTGLLTGVHEFNINRMIELSEILNIPIYCNHDTWKYCDNKIDFKKLCVANEVPVARKYDSLDEIDNYPVIVKPTDGSGSRGFSICHNREELEAKMPIALSFSVEGKVLIEDFIPYDAVIIHYTMHNGKCYYCGMSDKVSKRFENTGSSVMGIQTFPSKGQMAYLETLNQRVVRMFENAGFKEGPIWIEAFYDGKEKFIFNEMGYRFGGSLTYYPVKFFYGVDQLDLMIGQELGQESRFDYRPQNANKHYCILPIHIKPGKICDIEGLDDIRKLPECVAFVQVHNEGDEIKAWGSAQQVFGYLHVSYNHGNELKGILRNVMSRLRTIDESGENLLFTLFDINTL